VYVGRITWDFKEELDMEPPEEAKEEARES
jgi:hypothetical protein